MCKIQSIMNIVNKVLCIQLSKSQSIDFNNPSVVASDSIELRLLIKESLLIRDLTADLSLNCNVGSTELRLW